MRTIKKIDCLDCASAIETILAEMIEKGFLADDPEEYDSIKKMMYAEPRYGCPKHKGPVRGDRR